MSVIVKDLTKHYREGSAPAIANVSFEAPSGGITALLGPSGAGKSTVLRAIAGLELVDSGSIAIEGLDCSRVRVQDRNVGFVFQNYALFEHMTVSDNIGFGLRIRHRTKREIEQRVRELLELIQLPELARRFPSELSGGQRQRVAFARALAVEPKVLLLDEPFGALDVKVRVELREWLHRLHDEIKITTLLVTHDQTDAFEVAEHVVVLFDGKVAQVGAPHDIYDQPATARLAQFIGGANMITSEVQADHTAVASLRASVPGGVTDGKRVQVLVRPHDLRLTRPSHETPDLNLGEVLHLRRVGGYVKATVRLANGQHVAVECPEIRNRRVGNSAGRQCAGGRARGQGFCRGLLDLILRMQVRPTCVEFRHFRGP